MIIKILLLIVYIQGSFEEKKFTSFLKTDDENNYIIIIKILLPIVYNII